MNEFCKKQAAKPLAVYVYYGQYAENRHVDDLC